MTKEGTTGPLAWLPATCSKADVAALLGVSLRAAGDLAATGVLVQAEQRGFYQVLPSIHAYHDRLRASAAGRGSSTALADERLRNESVQREMNELKLAEIKGEILTLSEVSGAWTAYTRLVKAMFLAMPGKARSTIPHLTAHDQETLRQIAVDGLNELAEEIEVGLVGADAEEMRPPTDEPIMPPQNLGAPNSYLR
jgi:phage terminase Nu1 subunit (DNA packaging protein)